ncbi:RRXRR domain-containing protein, partial [Natroniella acetigena]|uniref:RRXRR domain-containing protein n=1 Tax=Natroniella acetigena TaxID=52004 RepID=UPI00200A3BD3
MSKQYAFVIDGEGKQLSPTKANKAWILIRKEKAKLITRYPLTIQLKRVIPKEEIDDSQITLGIDDGSKYVGFALVQKCKIKNKVIFKATMSQRQDVS